MRIVVTGAEGFLGWHTRIRLRAHRAEDTVTPVSRRTWHALRAALADADAVIHLAGVNRGEPDEVEGGNVKLATQLAEGVRRNRRPVKIVYANSIHQGQDTPYGVGKARAAEILRDVADETGGGFTDVRLPNIFGEHGRPRYNSFVATFIQAVISGESPRVDDRDIPLLPAQEAAHALIAGLDEPKDVVTPAGTLTTVASVLRTLEAFHQVYPRGEFPNLEPPLALSLFNAYRAAMFPHVYPLVLKPRTDSRGSFVETVRSHGGRGQTSFSTTRPGVTRGEHYHLRKVERFVVLRGDATISLRRLFHSQTITFHVSGDVPVAVDMPIGWAHNITNTGSQDLLTLFWAHELYDPTDPDTFPLSVPGAEDLR